MNNYSTEREMHVLYLITRAEMGGSQTHLLDLLKGFSHQYRLSLATGEEGFLTEEASRHGVATFVLPNLVQPLQPQRDARALFEITRLLKDLRPDLIHCHTSKAGILGRTAARLAGVPAIFTAHTWSFAEGTSFLWKMVGLPSERLAAQWTKKIVAVSESNRRLAVANRVADESKIVTIHNGIPDTRLRARPNRSDVPRITMVARFAPQKNQVQLLEALSTIDQPYRLTFVGDGPTRPAAEAAASALNIRNVEFLGVRKDTESILADSDIFVLATNWEGFPITILEAMRAGLPVVATDVDGVREAVVDGITGITVPRGNTAELAGSLRRLLIDPELRQSMGAAGRRRYEQHFTQAAMLNHLARIYSSTVVGSEKHVPALQSV